MLKLATADGGRFQERYEKELVLNGNSGRESMMESWAPNAREIMGRGYIVGSDFVALIVMQPKEVEGLGETERFFDSLMLLSTGTASPMAEDAEPGHEMGSYQDSGHQKSADTEPVPLSSLKPTYTENAKTHKVQGLVKLRVLVNRDGLVREVWLRSHLPEGLDQEAVRSVRTVKFRPATKDGRPVASWVNMEVDFRLPR
jgi:TonB family protein